MLDYASNSNVSVVRFLYQTTSRYTNIINLVLDYARLLFKDLRRVLVMNKFPCPHCGKSFNHSSTLSRHKNGSVKYNIKPCSALVKEGESHKGTDSVKILQTQIIILEKENEKLKKEVEDLKQIIAKKTTCQNTDTKPVIQPYDNSEYNPFKRSKPYPLPFTSESDLIELVKKTKPNKVFGSVMNLFHFNDDYKEYWNVVVRNKSHLSKVHYWNGSNWVDASLNDFINNFIRKVREMIDRFGFDDVELNEAVDKIYCLLDDDDITQSCVFQCVKSVLIDPENLNKARDFHGFKVK